MRLRVRRSPTGLPSSQPSPDDGLRRPSSSFTAVVLPAPLGPRNPNTSPRGTVIDRPARATVCPNLLVSSTVFTAGVAVASPRGEAAAVLSTKLASNSGYTTAPHVTLLLAVLESSCLIVTATQ